MGARVRLVARVCFNAQLNFFLKTEGAAVGANVCRDEIAVLVLLSRVFFVYQYITMININM